jgi:hypothetical protein
MLPGVGCQIHIFKLQLGKAKSKKEDPTQQKWQKAIMRTLVPMA